MRVLKKIVLFFVRELRDWIFLIAAFVAMVTIGEWSGIRILRFGGFGR